MWEEMNKSVTFLCDVDILKAIQKEADKDFEGNVSLQLRKILSALYEKK